MNITQAVKKQTSILPVRLNFRIKIKICKDTVLIKLATSVADLTNFLSSLALFNEKVPLLLFTIVQNI